MKKENKRKKRKLKKRFRVLGGILLALVLVIGLVTEEYHLKQQMILLQIELYMFF